MYWNNPLHSLKWPSDQDPIIESFHRGSHCLFYNPQTKILRVIKIINLKYKKTRS